MLAQGEQEGLRKGEANVLSGQLGSDYDFWGRLGSDYDFWWLKIGFCSLS